MSADEDPNAAESRKAMGSTQSPDSEGYRDDSECYQEEEEYPAAATEDAADEKFPWFAEGSAWDGEGFADEWMPDRALGEAAGGVDGLEPNRREWQVNIRLDRERYAALKRAAEVYGTSPTALARMLLNRGSHAILNAYRAEMSTFDWGNPRR